MLSTPSLRAQIFIVALVGTLTWGCLFLGAVMAVDLWSPFFPIRLGFSRFLVIGLSVIILLLLAYGHWIERRWIEVTFTQMGTPKLFPGSKPIRIVHLSDLHCTDDPTLENRIPEMIHPLSPDLVLLTGDYLASRKGIDTFKNLIHSINSPSGLFAVSGNHEVWYDPQVDLFRNTPAVLLSNEVRKVAIRGTDLSVIGIGVEDEEGGIPLISQGSPSAINILLYHYPDLIDRVAGKGIDLHLAGHTHGGQVALPYFGAFVTMSKGWKKYERGQYRVGETFLYVNRGLGSERMFFLPAIRIFSRPEIAVIDLVPSETVSFGKSS